MENGDPASRPPNFLLFSSSIFIAPSVLLVSLEGIVHLMGGERGLTIEWTAGTLSHWMKGNRKKLLLYVYIRAGSVAKCRAEPRVKARPSVRKVDLIAPTTLSSTTGNANTKARIKRNKTAPPSSDFCLSDFSAFLISPPPRLRCLLAVSDFNLFSVSHGETNETFRRRKLQGNPSLCLVFETEGG
ncbi:hypothetical protein EVAR_51683_1 [Eumeta japonica]|uniref:Uncharacterized protein n=1 Tax=Eumeta variegata TaxID=151549 RepID=A0A4C1Y4C3_EUMVA|nr:hypothetical protein EVAR_51683_1 [Eumeta japonica]